ncbi:hypothetical protein N7532_003597 [Penicillium argentinense]|uniref:Uncharacterized protein n=1 Tax=Penicillium argentinense TaxID=1131581 RepID=A0A9W9FMX9_9EURO|nr:uncharacterized protein N7532_003597 [Penicillium argentinense]KAJ5103068.1 hypothetical protein N7532_003597 [Penicillium argentinense]
MVVTRSATHATQRNSKSDPVKTKATRAKSKATKAKAKVAKRNVTNSQMKKSKTTESNLPTTLQGFGKSQNGGLMEWISLEVLADGAVPNVDEYFSILQELKRKKSCLIVGSCEDQFRQEETWCGPGTPQQRPRHPMDGFLSKNRGWMESTVEYRGQAARQLVYYFGFEDEESERHYLEGMKWRKRNLGMVEYDSFHVRFLEILEHVVAEDAVFLSFSAPIAFDKSTEAKSPWDISAMYGTS